MWKKIFLDVYKRQRVPLGVRWFSVDAQEGFKLNGEPLKLMGACRHQDQMPMGIALSDEMHRRDMQLLKDMGVNFVRLAHYPQDDAVSVSYTHLFRRFALLRIASLEYADKGDSEVAQHFHAWG